MVINRVGSLKYLNTLKEMELLIQKAIEIQAKSLILSFSQGYESIIPDSLGDISSLEELVIDDHPRLIKEIPKSIGKLSNLKELSIGGCHQLKYLPETIGNLTNLETLIIGDCRELERKFPDQMNLSVSKSLT